MFRVYRLASRGVQDVPVAVVPPKAVEVLELEVVPGPRQHPGVLLPRLHVAVAAPELGRVHLSRRERQQAVSPTGCER